LPSFNTEVKTQMTQGVTKNKPTKLLYVIYVIIENDMKIKNSNKEKAETPYVTVTTS